MTSYPSLANNNNAPTLVFLIFFTYTWKEGNMTTKLTQNITPSSERCKRLILRIATVYVITKMIKRSLTKGLFPRRMCGYWV